MQTISKWTMVLALLSEAAYGQQPPDTVASDVNGNTAMGTDALSHLISTYMSQNTAVGFNALSGNTKGFWNTATGGYALESDVTGSGNAAFGRCKTM